MSAERFLGGTVVVRQPEKGFRAGLDAVMLAACVTAQPGQSALELGSGAGTASLCLAARVKGVRILGLEIDTDLVKLARENAKANRLGARVRFLAGDVLDPPEAARKGFDRVFCNPPFHRGSRAPDAARARALSDEGQLGGWLAAGFRRTESGGVFTCILGADRLGEALGVLPARGTRVFPLWPRTGMPAKRVLVETRKGSRAAFVLLPGLVLHEADGRYTPAAEAVLRGGALAAQ